MRTSAVRFWIWGRCSMSKRRKSWRRCALTASTLRCSSPAICSLLAGGAARPVARHGRQRASSTRRWPGAEGRRARGATRARRGGSCPWAGIRKTSVVCPTRRTSPSRSRRGPRHALLVHERAVAREAVVLDDHRGRPARAGRACARPGRPTRRDVAVPPRPTTASLGSSASRTMRWTLLVPIDEKGFAGLLGLADAHPVPRIAGPGGSFGHSACGRGLGRKASAGGTTDP